LVATSAYDRGGNHCGDFVPETYPGLICGNFFSCDRPTVPASGFGSLHPFFSHHEVTLMAHSTKSIICYALALSLSHASSLWAGKIVNFTPHTGVASVAATAVVPPVAPNNDNVAGLSPNEFFLTQKNYTAIGPVDLTFDVLNTGGTTEYAFKEGVANSTGLPWVGYHIELGYGFDAAFVKSLPGDGLDFDAPEYDSGLLFNPAPGFYFPTATPTTEDDIVAGGGVMPNGGFAGYFRFSVDVPDGITQFTVRQSPIVGGVVPEPCGCVLGSLGLFSFLMYRWRLKK
jgi:hypothetical protein